VIEAKGAGKHEIVIWGDGTQTQSFMYIELVSFVEEVAGVKLKRHYDLNAPRGVAGATATTP
jgi:GDP-D-mannose 3',5'-epimerase